MLCQGPTQNRWPLWTSGQSSVPHVYVSPLMFKEVLMGKGFGLYDVKEMLWDSGSQPMACDPSGVT